MKKLSGNIRGLKANPIRRLENLYRRRTPPRYPVTPELAREVSQLSREIRRQIGLIIDRRGKIVSVIVGNRQGIMIPDLSDYRLAPGRLKGLRCVHTHLEARALDRDDLADLCLLRLDLMVMIAVGEDGHPVEIHIGHILPDATDNAGYRILPALSPADLDIGCLELIQSLEREMALLRPLRQAEPRQEQALLVSVTSASRKEAVDSLDELKELARSCRVDVIGTELQLRKSVDPRFLIGRGRLRDIAIRALQEAATLIVFDQELNPSQIRSITDRVELKVIDRTQLILDIFAQRARSREGKLQVELAQLRYLLPRLVKKNTAMSRLTGGIGGRGPGETKLEINRRRVRARIGRLEKALDGVVIHRKQQKRLRSKKGLPVISIIGYTNAGKSTLLNTLTRSRVLSEDRLFATLDPSSRRLKFPRDVEVIITDTVGFIKNLPQELVTAFRATLEELDSADLLLHVIDISNPRFPEQIRSVERILEKLDLNGIPKINVLNKMDRVDSETLAGLGRGENSIPICAKDKQTLPRLVERMARIVERIQQRDVSG